MPGTACSVFTGTTSASGGKFPSSPMTMSTASHILTYPLLADPDCRSGELNQQPTPGYPYKGILLVIIGMILLRHQGIPLSS